MTGATAATAATARRHVLLRLASAARHNLPLVLAATFVVGLFIASVWAPLPYSATRPDPAAILQPPGAAHWFGTDQDGTDIASQVIRAAYTDMGLALLGTALAAAIGVPLGVLASAGGRTSEFFMRGLDLVQAIPLLIIALVVVALAGADLVNVVLVIALIFAPLFIRIVRQEGKVVRSRRFVEAAQAYGSSRWRVTFRHVLPNTADVIFAQLALASGYAIITVAGLSFLGAGVPPPHPSWGTMVKEGSRQLITGGWWVGLFPSLMIVLTVAAFVALSGALHSLSDPLRRQRLTGRRRTPGSPASADDPAGART